MKKSIGTTNQIRKVKQRRQMMATTVTSVYNRMKNDKTFLKRCAETEKERAAAKKARKAEARQQLADIRDRLKVTGQFHEITPNIVSTPIEAVNMVQDPPPIEITVTNAQPASD